MWSVFRRSRLGSCMSMPTRTCAILCATAVTGILQSARAIRDLFDFCAAAEKRLTELRKKDREIYLCGDFNIAHKEIDLKNPKSNAKNAGFLPEERAWLTRMIEGLGWVDAFREFEKSGGHYTWWSYRPGVREKNVGWRLDYFLTNPESKDRMKVMQHCPEVMGSDHCPVRLTLKK